MSLGWGGVGVRASGRSSLCLGGEIKKTICAYCLKNIFIALLSKAAGTNHLWETGKALGTFLPFQVGVQFSLQAHVSNKLKQCLKRRLCVVGLIGRNQIES